MIAALEFRWKTTGRGCWRLDFDPNFEDVSLINTILSPSASPSSPSTDLLSENVAGAQAFTLLSAQRDVFIG